jgi:hypothetical protein
MKCRADQTPENFRLTGLAESVLTMLGKPTKGRTTHRSRHSLMGCSANVRGYHVPPCCHLCATPVDDGTMVVENRLILCRKCVPVWDRFVSLQADDPAPVALDYCI